MPGRTITPEQIRRIEDDLGPGPVTVVPIDLDADIYVEWHRHARHQLVYTAIGAMVVDTGESTWIVPSQRAIWMPAGIAHDVRPLSRISLRNVLVLPDPALRLPDQPCVINVTGLLRELILRAAESTESGGSGAIHGCVSELILDELRSSKSAPLQLPEPRDRRVKRVCDGIRETPADARSLDEWSAVVGASSRTLVRLFVKETGMSFTQWRQQARLLRALELLALGRPVSTVAYEVGYDSASSFIEMFKKSLGQTPSRYFGDTDE